MKIINANTSNHLEEVRYLFQGYYDELLHIDTDRTEFTSELANLAQIYSIEGNALLIAEHDDTCIACVALVKVNKQLCEMKRLYVLPNYRGKGFGRMLIEAVIQLAKEKNYRTIRLDTLSDLIPANTLYAKLGFKQTEAYLDISDIELTFWKLDLNDALQ